MRNENKYENENKNKRDDMAKVREGEIRGKVRSGLGNVVVYGEKDDARVRSVGEPTKQVSDLQYWYKAKIANVVKLYKHLEPIVNQAWDDRLAPRKKNGTAKGAPYNWFMSANMQERGCALWPKEDHPGGCLAVPYQVTNGLLEPIRVGPIDEEGKSMKRTIDDCPRARTNIKIGALIGDGTVEWHTETFRPDQNMCISSADELCPRDLSACEARMVVDKQTHQLHIYRGENDTHYIVESQTIKALPKQRCELRVMKAENGEGWLFVPPFLDEDILVYEKPDKASSVVATITKPDGQKDKIYPCTGFTNIRDGVCYQWYKTQVDGHSGWVPESLRWYPLRSRVRVR